MGAANGRSGSGQVSPIMRLMNSARQSRVIGPLALSVLLHTGLVAAWPPFSRNTLPPPLIATIVQASPEAVAVDRPLPAPPQSVPQPAASRHVRRTVAQPQVAAVHDPQLPAALAPQAVTTPPPSSQSSSALASFEKGATEPARLDISYLDNPKPTYPPASRLLGEAGKVIIRVHVSAEGHATDVEISRSSGFARLDEAARQTVSRWRFIPARHDGKVIDEWATVPIVFALVD